jgi:CP family cyanate transporter-like MFS transporter
LKKLRSFSSKHGYILSWRAIISCVLLTLVGFNLRSVILGVPPVLPLVQRDLDLSYAEAGLLTSMPPLILGVSAWSSGFLVERLGEEHCVLLGLLLLAGGALLRALWPTALALFAFTIVLCVGVVLAQTAVPVLARHRFPQQIGLVTALFSDGLIIGEAVAAGLTVPLMQRFLGGENWRGTFVLWSLPVLLLILLWVWLLPPWRKRGLSDAGEEQQTLRGVAYGERRERIRPRTGKGRPESPPSEGSRGRRVHALHLGILLGGGSLVYFGMNAWIASYNVALQRSALTPLVLGVLNTAQLPSSLAITLFAEQLAGRRWPFVGAGLICTCSTIAWLVSPAQMEVVWAALIGASSALVFTLGIALPPLLAEPDEVARLTGMTLSLTYAVAFAGPLVGGALWDLFDLPALAFLPVLIAGLLLIILGALLPERASFNLPGAGLRTRPAVEEGMDHYTAGGADSRG